MRVISIVALIRLMKLKEAVEDPKTVSKISDILVPQEFTRLDGIMTCFETAEQVVEEETMVDETTFESKDAQIDLIAPTDSAKSVPVKFHTKCFVKASAIPRFSVNKGVAHLLQIPQNPSAGSVLISKTYGNTSRSAKFWFGFRSSQRIS